MADKIISKAWSMTGWNFWTMLKNNAKFWEWFKSVGKLFKEIMKILIPLAISFLSTKSPQWTAIWTIVGKFALDTLEYFIKDIPAK